MAIETNEKMGCENYPNIDFVYKIYIMTDITAIQPNTLGLNQLLHY
jgi:hypothetical protein